jgi:hypothetical protein
VWPWDQAWYGELSTDLWHHLTHAPVLWARTMLTGPNLKPPGLVWLGQLFVPLRAILGSVESGLLYSVLLTQAVLLYLIFKAGRILSQSSRLVPLVGVVFAAGSQALIGLSHQFFTEPLQAVAVAWVLLIALQCKEWPTLRTLLHLSGALLVGLLAKATTPVYCILFVLYILYVVARRPFKLDFVTERRKRVSVCIAVIMTGAAPLTAVWYLVNFKTVWEHVRLASSGEVALQYGFRASVGTKLITWVHLLNQCFLAPYVAPVCLVLLVAAVILWALPATRTRGGARPSLPLLSTAQIGLVLLVFSMNDAVDARYLYALIAYLAVIVMALCSWCRYPAVSACVLAVAGLQWAVVNRVTLGQTPPLADQFTWLQAPHQDPAQKNVLAAVVRTTARAPDHYNVVGIEEPWFNANSASFFAAKNQLDAGVRVYYTSLGYAEESVAAALARIATFHADYVITLDEEWQRKPPDFLNHVSLPVLQELKKDAHYRVVPFDNGIGVVIFEHRQGINTSR